MKLNISRAPAVFVTDDDGRTYDLNRFHVLAGTDCEFIVHELAPGGSLQIQVKRIVNGKRQKRPVQSAIIRNCSVVAGHNRAGGPIIRPYVVNVDPDKEIFPIEKLINELMGLGVYDWQITPMSDSELYDCVASHDHPSMLSDGNAQWVNLPAGEDTPRCRWFKVNGGPTWAIRSDSDGLGHIYLWPSAAEASETILETARQAIRAKLVTSA
jgi:hypothetical protein